MQKQSFLKSTFVLALAGFISKTLGLVYRFPLSRLILDVGMGLYGMVYPIYTLILALSTAGVPVAISKLVSEKLVTGRVDEARKVFRVSLVAFSIIGLVLTIWLYYSARFLIAIGFVRDERAYWGLIAVAPAIFIVSLLVSFRGYFQGWRLMTPTAVSQVIEQIVRVATALILGYLLYRYGVEYAAAGAVFGAFTGGVAALVVLLVYFYFLRNKLTPEALIKNGGQFTVTDNKDTESSWQIFKSIIVIAVPISLAGLVMPIMQNIDLGLVPSRLLSAGYTQHQATALYGQLSQMAATLINMPTILTLSIAASVVPVISELFAEKKYEEINAKINTAVKVCVFLELPAFMGFFILAKQITLMLFANANAGIALAAIAPAVLFLGLHQVSSGILQGLGHPMLPLKNLIAGAITKVALTYYLTGIPFIGIRGAAYGTDAAFLISASLNFYSIYRISGYRVNVTDIFVKPIIAVGVMTGCIYLLFSPVNMYLLHSNSLTTLVMISMGCAVYFLMLLILKGIRENEILMVPRIGRKMASTLKSLHLI